MLMLMCFTMFFFFFLDIQKFTVGFNQLVGLKFPRLHAYVQNGENEKFL